MEGALNHIIENIPTQDMTGVGLLEPLSENLSLAMGMIEVLAGCIEAAGTNLSLSEFQEKIEGVRQDWDNSTLIENLQEFETSYLGMVENTAYSNDPLANYLFEGAGKGHLSGIQYFPNEAMAMRKDKETSLNHVWAEYYREVESGDTNRAAEFFSNLGNGKENIGILELDNILKKETYGSEYIQKGNDMSKEDINNIRSIFVQWIFSEYYGYEYKFPE